MSVSMTRNDGRHYYQINSQMETLVESLHRIQNALAKAPRQWWKYECPPDDALQLPVAATKKSRTADDDDETDDDDEGFQTAQS
jgi:hypothetical protein